MVTFSLPLFPYSPERPHLNLWLEAPDLLLAEVDLPKLVSAGFLLREKNESLDTLGLSQDIEEPKSWI